MERRSTPLEVKLTSPPVDVVDHVDLGNVDSERNHGLSESSASATNIEAGLTRRYTNPSPPGGWFEFDLRVPEGEPFLLRAVETYDRAQLKTYDVLVDGQEVHERRYQRTEDGVGSLSFQLLVTDPHLSERRRRPDPVPGRGSRLRPGDRRVWSMPAP